jgi:elongation factor G
MKVKEEEIPGDLVEKAMDLREKLIEAIAEADDSLLEKYLEGESLTDAELNSGLRQGVLNGKIVPVLCAAATRNYGTQPMLDLIKSYLPSPLDQAELKGHLPGK